MDKIEIGGTKGRATGLKIERYFKEFQTEYEERWAAIKFDPLDLDISPSLFATQFEKYQAFCDTFERKLAALFAFSPCRNFEDAIKLIEMAGSLLLRPKIFEEIYAQLELIVDLYRQDVQFVECEFKRGFDAYKDSGLRNIPHDSSFPPVSGTLMWIKSLRAHVSEPVKDIGILDFP